MEFKKHCQECEDKLGDAYGHVHRWLDEFSKRGSNPYHRCIRHHREGVEEVRKKWGDNAAYAAILHILSDEGDLFDDEEDFKKNRPDIIHWPE